ncbi:MAG: LA1599-like protein [uncultured bacterium]|nr:MAG: LA1599-like protein [uncultured bacterium]
MLKKIHVAIEREGVYGLIPYAIRRFQLVKKIRRFFLAPFSVPLALIILLASPFIKIRLILLFSNRIGHYPYNTELLLGVLDAIGEKLNRTFFYTVPGGTICNAQMHKMWKRVITILPFPHLVADVDRYLLLWNYYRDDSVKQFFVQKGHAWDAWNLLGKTTKPHVSFTEEEEQKGKELLCSLGIPAGARFVCLLGRDARYLSVYMPKEDLSYTNYRNVDINNYRQAAEYLANNGYYVIRMGRYVEKPFNVNHPNIIDYADGPYCSDFGDIYLSAKCFFFISVSCGLDAAAQLFRRPILQTNVPLVDPDFHPEWYLLITKKVMDLKTHRYLSFQEIAERFPWAKSNGARSILEIAKDNNLTLVENSPEEITEVVKEMVAILNETWQPSFEDELLQKKLWENFKDPGMRDLSAPPPNLPFERLKIPVFEGKNIDFNRKLVAVRLRMGTSFLKNNITWLLDQKTANPHCSKAIESLLN